MSANQNDDDDNGDTNQQNASGVALLEKKEDTNEQENDNKQENDDDDDDEAASSRNIQSVLTALAALVQAAQRLPTPDTPNTTSSSNLEYEASFPEFRSNMAVTHSHLLALVQSLLPAEGSDKDAAEGMVDDATDPFVWDRCADWCDTLMDQVEAYVVHSSTSSLVPSTATTTTINNNSNTIRHWRDATRTAYDAAWNAMGVASDAVPQKPQELHSFATTRVSRTAPFVPALHPDKPFAAGERDMDDDDDEAKSSVDHVPSSLVVFEKDASSSRSLPHASLIWRAGHGYETRYGSLRPKQQPQAVPNIMVAPLHHCLHPYASEIRSFAYTPRQLQVLGDSTTPTSKNSSTAPRIQHESVLPFQWIDTEEALSDLATRLHRDSVTEIAMDLEAHSHRSFSGMVCLIQISYRRRAALPESNRTKDATNSIGRSSPIAEYHAMQNFLIDAIQLRHCINPHLAHVLANPAIVKVLHGADSDIVWLQRDFSLYVCNMFDTGRAARALQFPSAGLAHLLTKYVPGIAVDKSHQLADWRIRPLPLNMQQYAVQDTHYLLDIYERLKWELDRSETTSIPDVLDTSRLVCLIRYCPEPFDPHGYRKLLMRSRGSKHIELNEQQEAVLAALWNWRDQTARTADESLTYVCTNANLIRMALSSSVGSSTTSSMTLSRLQGLFNSMPPLILQHSQELVELIHRASSAPESVKTELEDVEDEDVKVDLLPVDKSTSATSSAFFKPATTDKENGRRDMMSPVMGTEDLYEQAGWTTPFDADQTTMPKKENGEAVLGEQATTTDDGEDEAPLAGMKPKKLLLVHAANQDYLSTEYADHSLEFGQKQGNDDRRERGRTVDGMGAARGAQRSKSPASRNASDLEHEVQNARENAERIKSDMQFQEVVIPTVLGLIASTRSDEEEDDDGDAKISSGAKADGDEQAADLEVEFRIPRSIREIYMISNRNRRNKKTGSPTPERGLTPTNEKDREELAQAEAILKQYGDTVAGYFDDNTAASPGKRPRTKSGRESEESVPDASVTVPSKDDDISFMNEIGWIQNKDELEGVLNQKIGRHRNSVSESTAMDGGHAGGNNEHRVNTSTTGEEHHHSVGIIHPSMQQPRSNPFFAGAAAALVSGPIAQQQAAQQQQQRGQKKLAATAASATTKPKGNRSRQLERPEKKDGRSHAYKKR